MFVLPAAAGGRAACCAAFKAPVWGGSVGVAGAGALERWHRPALCAVAPRGIQVAQRGRRQRRRQTRGRRNTLHMKWAVGSKTVEPVLSVLH